MDNPAPIAGLMTVLLAVIVLVVVHPPGPLDERALADQRNGLLRKALCCRARCRESTSEQSP